MKQSQDIDVGVNALSDSPIDSREQAVLATYDFLKHMSTLAIVTMGGMLGLAQGLGTKISAPMLVAVALMGVCGLLSLLFLAGVALTQAMQRVHKSSNRFASAVILTVVILFAASVGEFVAAFLLGMAK